MYEPDIPDTPGPLDTDLCRPPWRVCRLCQLWRVERECAKDSARVSGYGPAVKCQQFNPTNRKEIRTEQLNTFGMALNRESQSNIGHFVSESTWHLVVSVLLAEAADPKAGVAQ